MDKQSLREQAGSKLRAIRKSTNLSVFKVGRAIGVSGSFISQIERGVRAPTDAILISLADLYAIPQSNLFDLYERLEVSELNALLSNPSLRKTFTQITADKNLSEEDVALIVKELQKVADKYLNPTEDPNV
ncbi:MAG: helix-turn-helix transcriptional regulator [Cellulosilyticaceae bacterium]